MALVKPFCGLRPPRNLVEQIESRPYDVLNSSEARAEAGDNDMSLYHIIRPEIDFPQGTDEYAPCIYEQAKKNFQRFQDEGWLVQDEKAHYYIYAQTMGSKTQYGIVLAAAVADYMNGVIKRHELTRADKEADRMRHVRATDANIEPVFLAYPDCEVINKIVQDNIKTEPEYDFIAPIDGFRHQFWVINDDEQIKCITQAFAQMPALYIADGHHRSAAAALVGQEKAATHPNPSAEYNYFMAVCFPASQLTVLDYNRVVKDLGGFTPAEILNKLKEHFEVTPASTKPYRPACKHEFSIYMDGQWYKLNLLSGQVDETHVIDRLDVSISSKYILADVLNITDLRHDSRIDFVGGLRGLDYLQQLVDRGEMAMALALYPVGMDDIMAIADHGMIMPPKTTWFEPKLRSGLVIHKLE